MTEKLIFLDFEGTGTDPHNDRIVEICMLVSDGDDLITRVNPGVPIPAEATAVHGITNDDVRDAPPFRRLARVIQQLIDGAVLIGYSCRRYDTVLLDAELRRAGQPGLPLDEEGRIQVQEIDLYQLWMRSEPRTLVAAAKRFAGVDLENAHSAEADTRVLPHLLAGMRAAFGLGEASIEEMCALCVPDGAVDRDGKFLRREDGVVVFNFSNSKGKPVHDDPGLLRWMLNKDFSPETKAIARRFLDEIYAPAAPTVEQGGLLF